MLAVLLPAALGASRAVLSGMPMVWYARPWIGFALYFPAGLLGGLLPHLSIGQVRGEH
jgi:hypothetical protein